MFDGIRIKREEFKENVINNLNSTCSLNDMKE
jgi:hypothetical protein